MAKYGKIIEDIYNDNNKLSNPSSMYNDFVNYFNNPTMTKINDNDDWSIYMSKTYCLLSTECRYIIAIIHRDGQALKTQQKLQNLKWVSIQTRTLNDRHDIPSHSYQPSINNCPLNIPIKRIKITDEQSIYECSNLPVNIILLHTEKNKSSSYQKEGNIVSALETYQTIINLL